MMGNCSSRSNPQNNSSPREAEIPYVTRPMTLDDLEDVIQIERRSFPLPWPAAAFRHDLTQNPYAYYFVVTPRLPPRKEGAGEQASRSWWKLLFGRETLEQVQAVGYAGFWALTDEAHISNVAVAPEWRGRGLGDLLMITLLEKASTIGMSIATLEVRATNLIAQNLYRKYCFHVVGQRRRYYSDNDEDALIMSTEALSGGSFQRTLFMRKDAVMQRLSLHPSTTVARQA